MFAKRYCRALAAVTTHDVVLVSMSKGEATGRLIACCRSLNR